VQYDTGIVRDQVICTGADSGDGGFVCLDVQHLQMMDDIPRLHNT